MARSPIVRTLAGALVVAAAPMLLAAQSAVPGDSPQASGLKIAARDQVTVTVLGQPDYSGKYQVDPAGTIEYTPMSLRVVAVGLTTSELAAAIRRELAARIFVNPQVTVELDPTAHMRVIVTGAVASPATYQFAGEFRVFEALTRAGSTTPDAADEALVVRAGAPAGSTTPDGVNRIRVDLHALFGGDMKDNVVLHDGDTVIVPKAEPIFVNGYVTRPGQYPYKRDMTVEQAITLAGGVSEQGKISGVKIKRGKTDVKKVRPTDAIQPGDIITVPRRIV
jgi:polysaccharide export outer membrane protein